MSSSKAATVVVGGLDPDALCDLIEQAISRLGEQTLSGGVSDAALAASVERLHRIETMAHGEKLRASRRSTRARPMWPAGRCRPRHCSATA